MTPARAPLVSVVIPTYNRARFVVQALSSVLRQTFRDYEVLVVDDGSTDDSYAVVTAIVDPRVSVVALAHSGSPARARNAGVGRATGRYVAFLDSDDLWEPSKLEDQLATLRAHPECRWCHTGATLIDETGALYPHLKPSETRARRAEGWILEALLTRRVGVSCSSVLVEAELLRSVGGFDETFPWGEDVDLWMRLASRSPIARVPEPRLRRRIHDGQFAGRGWRAPFLRTLRKTMRSTPSWRLRSLCAVEYAKVRVLDLAYRTRAIVAPGRPRRAAR